MVLMGKKRPDLTDYHINIGDNVIIAAEAVMNKDVPDKLRSSWCPCKNHKNEIKVLFFSI